MEALAVIGLGLIVIGGIWTIVAAFKTSIGWGIGCLVIPPVSLVFLFKYWDESKTPFFVQLAGIVLLVVGSAGAS